MLAKQGMKDYAKFLHMCLTERMKQQEDRRNQISQNETIRKDMLFYLLEAQKSETGLLQYSQSDVASEANLLVIAGSDTTSTIFAAMFFYLTRNPEIYHKLTSEIRKTFAVVDDIRSGTKLSSCHYLRAVIDETMRMNPPGGAELSREVLPGGLTVDGEFFDQGTNIGTALYCLHHDEQIFPNPFAFQPERWIADDKAGISAESVARAEAAFAPFSIGSRGCIGKNLAYMEMTVTMARLLYRLEVKKLEGDRLGEGGPEMMWGRNHAGHYQVKDAFIALRDGPMVQFKEREV